VAEDVSGTLEPEPEEPHSELESSTEPAPQLPATSTVVDAEPARPVGGVAVHSRTDRARRSAYRFRFVLFYFGLAVVAGSALGAFVVVLSRPKPTPPPPWSTIVPHGSDSARLYQIIDQVPKGYRGTDGKQLVSVSVAPPQQLISPDGQTTALIPIDRMQVNERGNITTVSAGGAVQFTLSGNGTDGTIDSGTPSQMRYYLLQREALEISLYALKYLHQLDSVTVLLPPSITLKGKTQQRQDTAVFLRRADVLSALSRPLRATLPPKVPDPASMSPADVRAVRHLGIPHTFTYSLIRSQDGTFVRVFEPPSS
jgi:hypothetical protein